MNYIFAGDRDISVWVLDFLIEKVGPPSALLVSEGGSHAEALAERASLASERILSGQEFRSEKGIELLCQLQPDYIFGIHFPYLISKQVLDIPRIGFLNLHPAFLPFNKGWHTPSWAIFDGTPFGATLHFMSESLDAGDIVHQKEIEVLPSDTANSLYQRVKDLELEVFKEAWPEIASMAPRRVPQINAGTSHRKRDLAELQFVDIGSPAIEETFRKLRALTTNSWQEAAYFIKDNTRYFVRIEIKGEDEIAGSKDRL